MSQLSVSTTRPVLPVMPPGMPAPAIGPVSANGPAKPKAEASANSSPASSAESSTDRLLRLANYGVGGAGSIAGLVAVPNMVVRFGPQVLRSAATISLQAASISIRYPGQIGQLAASVAIGTHAVRKSTEVAVNVAGAAMKAPLIGKAFSPGVSDMMTGKVLPAINAVGAGIAILDNGNRFYKAHKQGNTAGQVVAGAQIGLNALSAVTGFLPGKAQWVSAGAGLAGLGLEIAHQLGGVGK